MVFYKMYVALKTHGMGADGAFGLGTNSFFQ